MKWAYSRTVAWVLMSLAAGVFAWALDLRDANQAVLQATSVLGQQVRRAQAAVQQAQVQPSTENSAEVTALAQAWRISAQSHGSDARNTVAMLERVKGFCEAAGLKECQIKRSTVRISGMTPTPRDGPSASGPTPKASNSGTDAAGALPQRLVPHAINMLSLFDAKGVSAFAQALAESGLLYRLERVSIVQNRAEFDVAFFVLSSEAVTPGATTQSLGR